jgi:hypothetical protein
MEHRLEHELDKGEGKMLDSRPAEASDVREFVQYWARQEVGLSLTDGQRGTIIGLLNKHAGGTRDRYRVLKWLFPWRWKRGEHITTKTLEKAEWYALHHWMKPFEAEFTPKWRVNGEVVSEIARINAEIAKEEGQKLMELGF